MTKKMKTLTGDQLDRLAGELNAALNRRQEGDDYTWEFLPTGGASFVFDRQRCVSVPLGRPRAFPRTRPLAPRIQ